MSASHHASIGAFVQHQATAASPPLGSAYHFFPRTPLSNSEIVARLHDELSQLLSLALIHLDEAHSHGQHETIGRCQLLVREAMQASRALLHDLVHRGHTAYPPAPDFALRLQRCAQGLQQAHGLPIAFVCHGDPGALPANLSDTLIACTSELLTNALKYAGHGHIAVHLAARPGHLAITVTDQGPGLAALVPEHSSGLGLGLLRARLAQVGASLRWRSGSGSGSGGGSGGGSGSGRGVQARIRWSGTAP